MFIHQDELVNLLNLKLTGRKGWYGGVCPWCGKDKFGVKFNDEYQGRIVSSFNCFSGSCGQKGSLVELLKFLDRLDLVEFKFIIDSEKDLVNKIDISVEVEDLDVSVPVISPPFGFRREFTNRFLEEEKGFLSSDFVKFQIGSSRIEPALQGYIIFLVLEEGLVRGYLGRLPMTKEEYKIYEQNCKAVGKWVKPRFKNSDSEFGKLLGGIDELTEETQTVILVEGFTDKQNVDKILGLDLQEDVKCLCTFGHKVSHEQIRKLQIRKIKNIILLFDPDSIEDSKFYGFELNKYFNTLVGYVDSITKDIGSLTKEELFSVLDTLESPESFSMSKLQRREL